MNKKVLVLTLALIVAFAGSAMAEVKIGGDFTASVKQENFQVFKEPYTLKPSVQFKISASNSSVTTDTEVVETTVVDEETGETVSVLETQEKSHTNWDFTARLNSFTSANNTTFSLNRYKLELHDQYFDAWVWGREYVLTKKATKFDFIAASSGKDESADRARLAVPVMDLATVTLDFSSAGNRMLAFVDGKVEGFNVGLAYARTDWTPDSATNNIVAYGGGEFVAGEYVLDSSVAAGVTLGDDLGFALGLGAETDLTEEIAVDASVKFRNEEWAGGGFAKEINETKAVVLGAGTTYEVTNLQVTADVEQTFVKDNNSNVIELGAKYRLSSTLGYDDLFKSDKWYTNDAPAVRAYANIVDFKLDSVGTKFGAEVAAPVVENMVWAKAYGEYGYYKYTDQDTHKENDLAQKLYAFKKGYTPSAEEKEQGGTTDTDNAAKYEDGDKWGRTGFIPVHETKQASGFKVGADLYIQATDKLVITPFGSYASIGEVLTLGSKAAYKVGLSDTTLNFEVKRVTANDSHLTSNARLLQASVKVPF